MKKKLAIAFLLVVILFVDPISSAPHINIQTNQQQSVLMGPANLPTWAVGNYWTYNMNFTFIARDGSSVKLSIDADIENMDAHVDYIAEYCGEECYILILSGGDITGNVFLFDEFDFADLNAELDGVAYISTSTLAIKNFIFEVDGKIDIPLIGWRDMYFTMCMDFIPSFDFFDFPIYEEEQPWEVHIDAAWLNASVWIDLPLIDYVKDYSSSIVFNDFMSVDRTETITVPAGTFDTFVISGVWGYLSELWYAPEAGYLVKVDEGLLWDNGNIESVFNLELCDTNYDENNHPPDTPGVPSGPTWGETEIAYTYLTMTNDSENDLISYLFDWGDGTNSGWIGPYVSGTPVSSDNMWFQKGVYNVMVKAKDTYGLESPWSNPLSVTIAGSPKLTILIHHIKKKDEIDIPTNQEPEWYYKVTVDSNGTKESESYHHTDDGTYNGNWISSDEWTPDQNHEFLVNDSSVIAILKLMDRDDFWEGGSDDLADISGCNYPDNDGYDDGTPNKRGALYHGTYDLINNTLKPYNSDPDEYADYITMEDGYYVTRGDYQPDNSTEYEGGFLPDPENDAKLLFLLSDDYEIPQANIQISNPPIIIRPGDELRFLGGVTGGAPPYLWYWDFGDGLTSTDHNPTHTYYEVGTYTVSFTVTDGFQQYSTDTITVIVQENNNPQLSNGQVTWTGSGSTGDTFTFTVHYYDVDEDCPTVKHVIIDDQPHVMTGSGYDNNYKFEIKGKDLGKGQHTYYFHFEEAYGGVAETNEKTFKVVKSVDFFINYFSSLQKVIQQLIRHKYVVYI